MSLEISKEDSEKFAAGMRKQPIKLADLVRLLLGKEPKGKWRESKGKPERPQILPQDIEH